MTVNVPVVTTGADAATGESGIIIPAAQIFWGNPRYAPPYTYMELNRATTAEFGVGDTPQRDVAIAGTYGYWIQSRPAGDLTADVAPSDTTIQISNSYAIGVGDTITIDSERMLVSDKQLIDTGLSYSGASTAMSNDNVIGVASGAAWNVGEEIGIDSELMLIQNIIANSLYVLRAYDGTQLAAHSGSTIYAFRQCTVLRGSFGTTAASHDYDATTISALIYPADVHELAIAEALNTVAQKTGAYARVMAQGSSVVPGVGLPDLRDRTKTAYGRNLRQRAI